MKKLAYKLRPTSGLSGVLHFLFNALLPIAILLIIRLGFSPIIAASLVLLAKWRIFAVRPRYWLPNIRGNLVDIFVGLSVVAFVSGTHLLMTQIFWTVFYVLWLVWLKPKSNPISVMSQALIAQAISLVAFYGAFPGFSLLTAVAVTWLICYASARHFLGVFEEPFARAIIHIWAWFGALMAWILGHWVIDYLGVVPQIALIITALGYGLATMYYLGTKEKLNDALRRQLVVVMGLILLIIIVLSDWQNKTI